MKTIITIGEYLFLFGSFFLVVLFFGAFVKAHKIAEQKKEKDQNLLYTKDDVPPGISDKSEGE